MVNLISNKFTHKQKTKKKHNAISFKPDQVKLPSVSAHLRAKSRQLFSCHDRTGRQFDLRPRK